MTLLSWQLDAHQDVIDADAAFDREKDAEIVSIWSRVSANPAAYTECGMFDDIPLDETQRTAVIAALCGMRSGELKAWHAQSIVNTLQAAVDKIIETEAFDVVRFGGDL